MTHVWPSAVNSFLYLDICSQIYQCKLFTIAEKHFLRNVILEALSWELKFWLSVLELRMPGKDICKLGLLDWVELFSHLQSRVVVINHFLSTFFGHISSTISYIICHKTIQLLVIYNIRIVNIVICVCARADAWNWVHSLVHANHGAQTLALFFFFNFSIWMTKTICTNAYEL